MTGFEQYQRKAPDQIGARSEGTLLVLDANVLLHLYAYSRSAREEYLDVIEQMSSRPGTRLFIPHQVVKEFHRNRFQVIRQTVDEKKKLVRAVEELEREFNQADAAAKRVSEQITHARRDRGTAVGGKGRADELQLDEALERLAGEIEDLFGDYDLRPEDLVKHDPTLDRLTAVLDGHVGRMPDPQDLDNDRAEGARRSENHEAPGFRDGDKDENPYGDYLWWAEVMRQGAYSESLVVVTDDLTKGDWLVKEGGLNLGPHQILIEDARTAGFVDLAIISSHQLLEYARTVGVDVSDEAIQQATSLQPEQEPWTAHAAQELLNRLRREGRNDQANMILLVSVCGDDGYLDRQSIIEWFGWDAGHSLRRFTMPATRIADCLKEDGLLDDSSIVPLEACYDGPGAAVGYQVPAEFSAFWNEKDLAEAEESMGSAGY
jgi:hypothetical protein